MPRLHGLIFDLDGTLVDSAPDLGRALNAMLKQHGRRELPLDGVKSLIGDGLVPMMTRAFEATGGVPPDFDPHASYHSFVANYRALDPDPGQVYPQAREMLETCLAAGVKLGVCTNKQEVSTLRLLEELDIKRYFTFIAGGDTFPVHKPDPGHVTGVMKRIGTSAPHCAMIGDSSNDILAAHGAGIPCIVVTHGYGLDMGQAGADRLIGGFGELAAALGGLGFDFV